MKDPRAFGRHLRRLLYSDSGFCILDSDPFSRGGTWLQGGCFLLALALYSWLRRHGEPAKLRMIYGSYYMRIKGPCHITVELNGWFFDGEGTLRAKTLIKHWRETGERIWDAEITPFDERSIVEHPDLESACEGGQAQSWCGWPLPTALELYRAIRDESRIHWHSVIELHRVFDQFLLAYLTSRE